MESTATAVGAANELAMVLTVPGVKTLSEPVATACSPCRTVLPERESVSLTGALRRPGRVGVKRTKTWQVLGTAPGAAGLSAPLQVLLVMLKSGTDAAVRLTFWSTTKVRGIVALALPTGVEGKMTLLLSLRAMLLPESAREKLPKLSTVMPRGALSGVPRAELPSCVGL